MQVYKTRNFAKWAKTKLPDRDLCRAVAEMESGLLGDSLGGGVYKKRIALSGRGKRGGARVLLAYKAADRAIFVVGYGKNERTTISPSELIALRELAKEILNYTDAGLARAVSGGVFIEVDCNGEEQNF
jgi:hypothetical protein